MGTGAHDIQGESFPRQRARTRGFRLGAPRSFRIARREDGSARVVFIRSADGRTASGDLWVADQSDAWRERCVVHAAELAAGDLPPEERARRERMREVTSGITAYSLDANGDNAAFVVDGIPYRVSLDDGHVQELPHQAPAIDPQMSPDGQAVAFVSNRRVFLVDESSGEDAQARAITPEEDLDVCWGLADFIAAEELERHRGLWWLSDSRRLLIERFDETPVEIRWIGDPAQPENEPRAHRYPAAGTANAQVSLHVVDTTGSSSEIAWDHSNYPYLASVHVAHHEASLAIVSVLSRDQQRQLTLRVDGDVVTELAKREQQPWITVMGGVPTVDPSGALIDIIDDDDVFRVSRDGKAFSPREMNVEAVLDCDADRVVVLAALEPTTRVVAEVSYDGSASILSEESQWTSAVVNGDVRVEASARLGATQSRVHIIDPSSRYAIESAAEVPIIHPQPTLHRTGDNELATALLLPHHHEPGMRWPVICSPYGGPHAQRVIAAGGAYLTEQWLADQGFAVVIIDGRGTPGRGPAWEYAVHLDLAMPALHDQVAGLHALAERENSLDLTRVGIRGWSFGGYLAALAVLERPDVFHAAVAGAPVTDWQLYDTAYTERYLGDPRHDAKPYENASLLSRADALTRPLLLIHGLADDNVLAAHSLQMSSALLSAGKPHNFLPLSGVTHMTPQEVVAENLLLTEVEFFRTHLG